jgi:hypothetical protein
MIFGRISRQGKFVPTELERIAVLLVLLDLLAKQVTL